jgi:Holliday junction resolvase RusA-like endonuclease
MTYIFRITPLAKPRMTQRDKWAHRKPVAAYFAFKTLLVALAKLQEFHPSDQMRMRFYLPMPKSWSQQKKQRLNGRPHQQKPDRDNLEKGVLDAFFTDDSRSWHGETYKYWAVDGRIEIEHISD